MVGGGSGRGNTYLKRKMMKFKSLQKNKARMREEWGRGREKRVVTSPPKILELYLWIGRKKIAVN